MNRIEESLWVAVMVAAGAMAVVYIIKIVADIKKGRRHKKLKNQRDKEKEVKIARR